MPDYVAVLAKDGRLLGLSTAASRLTTDDVNLLDSAAINAPAGGTVQLITLGGEPMLLVVRQPEATRTAVARVAVAAPVRPVVEAAVRELIGTMLVMAPILLLVSLALAYVIAGRALEPVDRIINEVQAITDGRSLHRRLPATEGAELQRLVLHAERDARSGSRSPSRRCAASPPTPATSSRRRSRCCAPTSSAR